MPIPSWDDARRIKRVVEAAESQLLSPQHQAQGGSPYGGHQALFKIRVTDGAAVLGDTGAEYWPAYTLINDPQCSEWIDWLECWFVEPNGEAVAAGIYLAQETGSYLGLPAFVRDVPAVGLPPLLMELTALDNVPRYQSVLAIYVDELDGFRLSPRDIATTLNGSIDAITSTVVLSAAGGIEDGELIQIDNEQMLVNSGGGTTSLLVSRGQSGGAAADPHANGASVYAVNNGVRLDFVAAASGQAGNVSLANQVMGAGEKYFASKVSVGNSTPAGPLDITGISGNAIWLRDNGGAGIPDIRWTNDATNADYLSLGPLTSTDDNLYLTKTGVAGVIALYIGATAGLNLSPAGSAFSVGAQTGVTGIYNAGTGYPNGAAVMRVDGGIVTLTAIAPTNTVPNGFTGNTAFTAYSVICAGTTSTGAFQNVSGVGTAGQVLTSNGAATLPTWQAAGGGYTDEQAQDAVGAMIAASNTITLTYVDATPTLSAEVVTQMSLTSDGFGLKLSGDETTPADNKFYGKAAGAKGWFPLSSGGGLTWVKVTKSHTDFQTAATTNTIVAYTAPAGTVLHAVKLKHSTAFAGTGIISYLIAVKNPTETFINNFSVMSAVAATTYGTWFQATPFSQTFSHTGTTEIQLKADSSGANLSASTAGSVDVWLLISVAA